MIDDSISPTPAGEPEPDPAGTRRCPWCSAVLPPSTADECPSCHAHLVESEGVEILGVTAVDPSFTATAAAPRKVRALGSIMGSDDDVALPSPDELPALAPPDFDVQREMLRLELDARLTALQAEVQSIESEDGSPPAAPEAAPGEQEAPESPGTPEPPTGA
jgi:hypothetical protein